MAIRAAAKLVALFVVCSPATGRVVRFNNSEAFTFRDADGNILDAHDGTVQLNQADNRYYMHVMSYGLCSEPKGESGCPASDFCGTGRDHNISVYSSEDLSYASWKFEGNAIDISNRPAGTVYRPDAHFNKNTNEWVLWWNWGNGTGNYLATATSKKPAGPFTLIQDSVSITREAERPGDFHLFVDDDVDNTAYVIYSASFVVIIERLTRDHLRSTLETSPLFGSGKAGDINYFVEAPTMFKRGQQYYVLFGHCCCFCKQGSGLLAHTSIHPLGPYTMQGQLACEIEAKPPAPSPYGNTPGQGCQRVDPKTTSTTRSQQNWIVQVALANGSTAFVYTGDRWQQAADGIKGHEPQVWIPLAFDDDHGGALQPVGWVDSFELDVQVPPSKR